MTIATSPHSKRRRFRGHLKDGWRQLTSFVANRSSETPTIPHLGWSGLFTPLALLICGVLLFRQITPQTLTDLKSTLSGFGPKQWIGSLVFALLSFLAIGRNEAVAHDLVDSRVAHNRARKAGMQAVALAQTLGFGTVTAALARKRALPELDGWTLARVSVAATLVFWAAFGVLLVQILLTRQTGTPWIAISTFGVAFVLARLLRPTAALPGLTRWRILRTVLWTNLDLAFAATALFVFVPSGYDIAWSTVFCAYVIALGTSLISQSPGGLGAFELTLFLALPQIPDGVLLGAIVAYRVTYHTLPLGIAGILLLRGPIPDNPSPLIQAPLRVLGRTINRAGQGDWGLARQDALILFTRDQSQGWLVGHTLTSLTAIGRPLGTPAIDALQQQAKLTGHLPFLYKCDKRTAVQARRRGWAVYPLAQEAVIAPAVWSVEGSDKRQLRRKLRQATKEGLKIETAPHPLPLAEMAHLAQLWKIKHHGERGFSLGRFHPQLVANQLIIVGRVDGAAMGFVSFHRSRGEWSLDLMRLHPKAPSGTMHALITAALSLARQRRIPRLSLAACLRSDIPLPRQMTQADSRQFKNSFGPKWKPLYIAAPNWLSLGLGLASTTLAIHAPGPISTDVTHPRPWPRRGAQIRKFRIAPPKPACESDIADTQNVNTGRLATVFRLRRRRHDKRSDNST